MTNKIRKFKINRHEKVAQLMVSGKQVTPEDFAAAFKGTDQESLLYKLSANMGSIREDGGIIKVYKNGRNVIAYQLVNFDQFSENGRYVGPTGKQEVKVVDEIEQETVDVE